MYRGMELNIHFQLMLSLRTNGAIPPLPICLHGMHKENFTFTFTRTEIVYSMK